MEWFESWFDTSYYHTLYKNRDDKEAEQFIANLNAFLKLKGKAKVLDLACGKGRHSVTLHKFGYDVVGADLSSNSIEIATRHNTEGLKFIVHDMREPIPNEKFDAVFNLFTSFGYFDSQVENLKVLNSINEMLYEGGLVIIDFMNAAKIIGNLVENEKKTIDGICFNLTRTYDGKHIFKHIKFEDKQKEHHYTERVQALQLADFNILLAESNFEILRTFGDFELNEFDEQNSNRLIIIAQKK